MEGIAVVGLDLAKNVFQVHGVNAAGGVVARRQVRRGQLLTFFSSLAPCLVDIEACASAHHWARELMALGHQVRRKRGLIPVLRRLSWTGRYCLVLSRQGSLVCQVICQLMGTASVALGC